MKFVSETNGKNLLHIAAGFAAALLLANMAAAQTTPGPSDAALLKAPADVAFSTSTFSTSLPDAPAPAASTPTAANSEDAASMNSASGYTDSTHLLLATSNSRYSTVLIPGETRVPFTVRQKFIYSMLETIAPEDVVFFTLGAGYTHLVNGDPKYGTDGNGFGEREGTSALRVASIHFIGDGVLASALHQDPRYFALGPGHSFLQRTGRVLVSAVTSHSDRDGHLEPDYSGLTARAATAAMTVAYYPQVSATGTIAVETFGYSLLGDMAGDALLEFVPELLGKHKH